MADPLIRMPRKPLDFTGGTKVTQQSSLGDTKSWEIDYRVHSPMDPAAFVEHVRTLVSEDPALKMLPVTDPVELAGQYKSERGGRWRVTLRADAKRSDGSYRVTAKAMRLM